MLHKFGLLAPIFPQIASISLEELKVRLDPIRRLSQGRSSDRLFAPFVSRLSLESQIELCKQLKLSNTDVQFITFLYRTTQLIDEDLHNRRIIEPIEWAYLYAHNFSTQALRIISCHLDRIPAERVFKEMRRAKGRLSRLDRPNPSAEPVVDFRKPPTSGNSSGKDIGDLIQRSRADLLQ